MKLATVGLAICVTSLAACAHKNPAPPPEPVAAARGDTQPAPILSGKLDEQTVTATATVQTVDQKTRHVTLKRPDGTKFTIVAGPEVRNLPQLKKGDVVRLEYRQSIAYEVNKAGQSKPGVSTSTDVTRARPGDKPGGSVTDTLTVRMTITAIDKGASEATLLGPDGVATVVKVRDPRKLDSVEVGDVVDLTYTEALAVAVEKSGKR